MVYFDLFDFAPAVAEIERWLLAYERETESAPRLLSTIRDILESDDRIESREGFYFLCGRSELANLRKTKYDYTDQKWKRVRPFIRLLSAMPGVRAVWLANSVAWANAREQSDIDVVIVAAPGAIWTARFFTAGLMKLLRQRPEEQEHAKAICLSFYISQDHLNLEPYKIPAADIHFAFWATQMYPLYDPHNLYVRYQEANPWLNTIFAHHRWNIPIPRRQITISRPAKWIKRILEACAPESLLRRLQWRILPERLRTIANQDQRVILNNQMIKLHDNDQRAHIQALWEQRI